MKPDDELCYCFHVRLRKVVNFLRIERPRVASLMSNCYGAGTGCGWCRPILIRLWERTIRDGESVSAEATGTDADELTAEQYAHQRAAYIRAGKGTPAPGATPLPPEPTNARQEPQPPPLGKGDSGPSTL